MTNKTLSELIELVGGAIQADEKSVTVTDADTLKKNIEKLVLASATAGGVKAAAARYLVRGAALDLGIIPSSIHELYIARGKGDVPNTFTVPAMNLRVLPFDAARAIFRVAKKIDAGAMLFEIARSEMGYTDQRPTEYTTNVLGAAIAEGFIGPVFIQGDHFQISASRYFDDAETEVKAVKDLTVEAIHGGFYNIDVDTSTLVLLDKETIPEQQILNSGLSAEMTAFIRSTEPEGITISVGGEIGEVGGHNSTVEELRAYTDGYNAKLAVKGTGLIGLSKISIQTGTSHGGVVLPDGSIAQVSVDFDTLKLLSQIARDDYHMGGAVQHGASTLPQDAFGKFVEAEAVEVHLATNFQNIFFDEAPEALVKKMYAWLDENAKNERKPDMTDDQFYYKSRKRVLGAFKKEILNLSEEDRAPIAKAWETQFTQLFDALAIANTKKFVEKTITPVKVLPSLKSFIEVVAGDAAEEDVSDLAD
ncbi:MAG: class II fructose-bisphosphate aldolase [Anaerolineales bacterium]